MEYRVPKSAFSKADKGFGEGTFKRALNNKYVFFDYSNTESWKKHNLAKQKGEIPIDAKIGGEIGIHGVPKGTDFLIDLKTNWTLGCIALKNKDVNEIYPFISKNTMVVIKK